MQALLRVVLFEEFGDLLHENPKKEPRRRSPLSPLRISTASEITVRHDLEHNQLVGRQTVKQCNGTVWLPASSVRNVL